MSSNLKLSLILRVHFRGFGCGDDVMNLLNRLENGGTITDISLQKCLSKKQINNQVVIRAEEFKKLGMMAHDRVLLLNGNSISFFIDLFAIWSLDGCAIPVDTLNPKLEVQALAGHCSAAYLVDENSRINKIGGKNLDPQSAHLILYTSGATGSPKAVVHTLKTLEARMNSLELAIPKSDYQKTLCMLPTHFGHGLIGNSLFPYLTGADLFISKPFDLASIQVLSFIVDREEITFISTVPTIWSMLSNSVGPQKNSLRRIHCASAMFSESLFNKIKSWSSGSKLYNVYGLTELGSWISGQELNSEKDSKFVGTGWSCNFKIQNEGLAKEGLIFVQTASLMINYLQNEDLYSEKTKDGWLNTGDIGLLDERGRLIIISRNDDLINRGGMKIYPEDVETVLFKCPALKAACVFSIPNEIMGDSVAAAIVTNDSTVSKYDIEKWCRMHLSPHRVPTKWYFLDSIPMSSRGKINRKEVRDHCINLQVL